MKRLCRSIALACAGLLAATAAQALGYSADAMGKVIRIGDPQISPDGKTIAILVGRPNFESNRFDSEIDAIDVRSHASRVLVPDTPGLGAARWAPAGDRIAYLVQDANHIAQIFLKPAAGGEARQLTHAHTAVLQFSWKPDGTAIVFACEDEAPKKTGEAKFEDAFEVGNNDYLTRAADMPVHLWSIGIADGAAKRLTSGSWSLPRFKAPAGAASPILFTADQSALIFVRTASPRTGDTRQSRLVSLDLASGTIRELTTMAQPEESNPGLSPDGRTILYRSKRGGEAYNESAIFTLPLTGGTGTDVAAGIDRDIQRAAWLPDGRSLILAANDGTAVGVWVQAIGKAARRLSLGDVMPSSNFAVARDGGIAFTATTSSRPSELFYLPRIGAAPVQLTHLQTATDGLDLGRTETVHWRSDAFDVDGVLTYPPGYVAGRPYPLVVYLHGGPTLSSLTTFADTNPAQIFAGQGWLVFEPNYRGGDGRGNAFEAAINGDAGAGPGRDIMTGVEMLKARGIVDPAKIAVGGWSYGGFMTAWLIGNYPDAWRAAVAGGVPTDLVDQYALSDTNVGKTDSYGPSPFVGDNLKKYQAQSPLTYLGHAKAPTLVMSDVGDWRATVPGPYKLFHALRDNGVEVKFFAYPVPGHFPADPIRRRDVWRRWVAWLSEHFLDQPTTAKP